MELAGANCGLPCARAMPGTEAAAPARIKRRGKSNVMESLPAIMFWQEGEPGRAGLSTRRSPLDIDPEQINRLGRGHEQMIALGPGETEIGAAFRQADAAEQLAGRIPPRDTGIAKRRRRTAPDIAGAVGPHAIGTAMNAVDHAVGEGPQV